MFLTLWCAGSFLKSLVGASLSFGLAILDVSLGGLGVLWFLHVVLRVVVDLPTAPPAGQIRRGPRHRGRATRRRQGGTRRGWSCQHHTSKPKKSRLIALRKRPPRRRHDVTCCHPPRRPVPSGEPHRQSTCPGGPAGTSPSVPNRPDGSPPSPSLSNSRPGNPPVRDVCPPTSARGDVKAGSLGIRSSEGPAGGDPGVPLPVGGHILLFSRETLALQEGNLHKCRSYRLRKRNRKKRSCLPEPPRSDARLHSSVPDVPAGDLDSGVGLPSCSSRGTPRDLHVLRQPSRPHTWEESLRRDHVHLLCRWTPSCTESALSAVQVSGVSSALLRRTRVFDAFSGLAYRGLSHLVPLLRPEGQPPPFPQPLPRLLALPLPPPHPQLPHPAPLPILPPHPPPQMRSCAVPRAPAQPESQLIWGSPIDNWVSITFFHGSWSFASVWREDREAALSTSALRRASRALLCISVLPGEVPIPAGPFGLSGEPPQPAEPHVRMGLILPRWGLPRPTQERRSPGWAPSHWAGPPESASHDARPWVPAQPRPGSAALHGGPSPLRSVCRGPSGTAPPEAEERREKGNGPENGPGQPLPSVSGDTKLTGLRSDWEPDPHGAAIALSEDTLGSGPSVAETQPGLVPCPIPAPLPPGQKWGSTNHKTPAETQSREPSRTPIETPQARISRALRTITRHLFPCAFPRERGSPTPRARRRSPETRSPRAAGTSTSTTQTATKASRKHCQARFRHEAGADIAGPPEPRLSPEEVGRMEGKAGARAQAGPMRAHPRALPCRPRCCSQRRGQRSPQGVSFPAEEPPPWAPRGQGAPSEPHLQASPWPGAHR